jgi:hypothetical protein
VLEKPCGGVVRVEADFNGSFLLWLDLTIVWDIDKVGQAVEVLIAGGKLDDFKPEGERRDVLDCERLFESVVGNAVANMQQTVLRGDVCLWLDASPLKFDGN